MPGTVHAALNVLQGPWGCVMRVLVRALLGVIMVLAAGVGVLALSPGMSWSNNVTGPECCVDIAHAGGLLNGEAYTNSLEALEANLAAGRRVFEIDLIESADGQLVLAHDWDAYGTTPPTLAQYRRDRPDLTVLTFGEFTAWQAERCETCTIVTDPKVPLDVFWRIFSNSVPEDVRRSAYVLQAYSIEDLDTLARTAPKRPVILTIYRMETLTETDLERAAEIPELVAVTMPMHRLPSLARIARRITGKPVYTHGYPWMMASESLLKTARLLGATGFYRD